MSKKILSVILFLSFVLFTVYLVNNNSTKKDLPVDVKQTSEKEDVLKEEDNSTDKDSSTTKFKDLPKVSVDDWNLKLVNYDHPLKKEVGFKKDKLANGQIIDARITDALMDLMNDAKKENLTLIILSAYRSIAYQEKLVDDNISKLKNEGYTKEDAKTYTYEYQAIPRTSEHHLGLAIDFSEDSWYENETDLVPEFEDCDAGIWLAQNAKNYGFILRYPKGEKEDITQIKYEPWHFRYVGIDNAKFIEENNLTLEEYIEILKNQNK